MFESNRLEVAEAAVVTPSVNFRQKSLLFLFLLHFSGFRFDLFKNGS